MLASATPRSEPRRQSVMPEHQNPDAVAHGLVDHRIGVDAQWERPPVLVGWCPEAGMGIEQFGHPFELVQKAHRNLGACVLAVVTERAFNVLFGLSMKGVGHPNSARSRARTSCPRMGVDVPLSISASLRAASSSQAAS